MEEVEVSSYNYTQLVSFLNRATKACVKQCDTLSKSSVSDSQQDCLKTCGENQAISTKVHLEYMRKLAESKLL